MTAAHRRAFSLVELSIVLVILGLLVGGIFTGKSLIHAAELRSITTERNQIISAVQVFRDKYFQLPGDFSSATRVWGWQFSGGANCATNSGASVATNGACDGDGNGQISGQIGASNNGFFENAQFAYQLKLAGLLNTSANGFSNTPNQDYGGRMGYWSVLYYASDSAFGGTYLSKPVTQNVLSFGGTHGNATVADQPMLLPEDAMNIDAKLDDGLPITGFVTQKVVWATSNCYSGNSYMVTYNASASCVLIFFNQF